MDNVEDTDMVFKRSVQIDDVIQCWTIECDFCKSVEHCEGTLEHALYYFKRNGWQRAYSKWEEKEGVWCGHCE